MVPSSYVNRAKFCARYIQSEMYDIAHTELSVRNNMGCTVCATMCYVRTYVYTECPRGECARPRENVPYIKVHRYNPKHLYPKLNGYGNNGERKVWSSCGSTYCTCFAYCYSYTAHVRTSVSQPSQAHSDLIVNGCYSEL